MNLSYSRLQAWRKCQTLHYNRYIAKITSKKEKEALTVGSCIHDMLADVALNKPYTDSYNKYLPTLQETEYDYKRISEIVENYIEMWSNDPLEYHEVEMKLQPVELIPAVYLVGRLDGLATDRKGKTWVIERKTSATLPDAKNHFFTSQALLYVYMLREQGIEVSGILWDYIRTKAPTIPEMLKKGGLTRRVNIDTTYKTYLKAIHNNNLNEYGYIEELRNLQGKEFTFYYRHRQPINEHALEIIVEDAKIDAKRMLKQQMSPTMNLTGDCKFCEYSMVCQAILTESDPEFIIEQYFKESK